MTVISPNNVVDQLQMSPDGTETVVELKHYRLKKDANYHRAAVRLTDGEIIDYGEIEMPAGQVWYSATWWPGQPNPIVIVP